MSETTATGVNSGKTLGIVGLVLAFVANIVGLIVSIVALRKSKKAGFKNTPAVAGIVISIISIIGAVALIIGLSAGAAALVGQCAEYGPGVHELDNGVTITCS